MQGFGWEHVLAFLMQANAVYACHVHCRWSAVAADVLFAALLGSAGVASTDVCLNDAVNRRIHLNMSDPQRIVYSGADSHVLKWF